MAHHFPTQTVAVIGSALAANKYHLGLFNGAAGNWLAEVVSVVAHSHLTAAVAGLSTTVYLKRTTAAGSGTSAPRRSHDPRAASIAAAVAGLHAYTVNPTEAPSPEIGGGSLNTEETSAPQRMVIFEASPWIDPIRIYPGQGVVIQQSGLASAGALSAWITFRVVPRVFPGKSLE